MHTRTGSGHGIPRSGASADASIERRTVWETGRVSDGDANTLDHRSAHSPKQTPEEPPKDNFIAGPQTGTTRSEPSAPASAGAGGRLQEHGSRPASECPAQPPSRCGGESPRD